MSDPEPRPLTGLELARAALLGISWGIVLAPALARVELKLEPGGLAPLAPAWVARGASAAAGIALAWLLVPRLLRRPPPDSLALRRAVGVRAMAVAGFAGATATVLLSALELIGAAPDERRVLSLYLAPLGAGLAGALAGAAFSGARGRWRAARAGAAIGFLVWVVPLVLGCLAASIVAGSGRTSASDPVVVGVVSGVLALALFGVPALARPKDAFDHPPG